MSIAQEILALLVLAILCCGVIAYIYKSSKLFTRLLLTLLFGLLVGIGYCVITEKIESNRNVVKITSVATDFHALPSITNTKVIEHISSVKKLVATAVKTTVDYADVEQDVDYAYICMHLESKGFKTKQLKIRC